jgi:hypothetical protein
MFKNAQIEDRVWDSRYGWGTIKSIYPKNLFPIKVEFDYKNLKKDYTFDGRSSLNYIAQVLFWNSFKIPLESLIKPLLGQTIETQVLVPNDIKEKRYFSHFHKEGKVYCYKQECASWLETTSYIEYEENKYMVLERTYAYKKTGNIK